MVITFLFFNNIGGINPQGRGELHIIFKFAELLKKPKELKTYL